jgi:endoglucanase
LRNFGFAIGSAAKIAREHCMKTMGKFFWVILALLVAFSITACKTDDAVPANGGREEDDTGLTAAELVAQMTIGWNLGNTLDAANGKASPELTVEEIETMWVGGVTRVTTKAHIAALKKAGFNTIRLPVTWFKVCDNDYNIRADFMARVKEIADYAVENEMFIILNTHHDESIFEFTDVRMKESLKAFKKIWEQIAETFKDYDEKLIFEGLNEPRTRNSAAEWDGGTLEERRNLMEYYEVFIATIRASGGNNGKRILMINPYAAGTTTTAIKGLYIPNDTLPDKIIVSVHAYTPYNFALNTGAGIVYTWDAGNPSDTSAIRALIDRAYNKFVQAGIPVVIGEFGAMDRSNNTDRPREQYDAIRAAWAEYYVGYARSKGIPCVWWDNHSFSGGGERFGLLNRDTNAFTFPLVVDGLMRGAGVSVSE